MAIKASGAAYENEIYSKTYGANSYVCSTEAACVFTIFDISGMQYNEMSFLLYYYR